MDHSFYVAGPIFAKEQKDIPEWMKGHHDWQVAVDVNKLPKIELKVKMCCLKCEEKVIEELRGVRGVFDVKTERVNKKVIVVGSTKEGPDSAEIVSRARKIHRKARITHTTKFIATETKGGGGKDGGDDKKGKPNTTTVYVANPLVMGSGYGAPTQNSGDYRPSQSYPAREYYPTYAASSSGDHAIYTYFGPY